MHFTYRAHLASFLGCSAKVGIYPLPGWAPSTPQYSYGWDSKISRLIGEPTREPRCEGVVRTVYHLTFLLGGLILAPLGWLLAWLASIAYRSFQDRVPAAQLRLLIMAFLGIAQSLAIFIDDYWGVPVRYLWGLSSAVASYAVGWFITAAAIEFAIRAVKRRKWNLSEGQLAP